MNNKNIIPDYDLLAKYFAGEVSTTQIKDIEEWVAENPANKKTYDRIHFLWMQSAKTELEKKVNVDDAWTKMKFKMNAAKQQEIQVEEIKTVNIFTKTGKRFLQFAAIIILAFGIGTVMKLINSEPDMVSQQTIYTALNLTLPDKSEIKLNKKSKISYPNNFKGENRLVKLKGEAFFDVTPNKEKPFIIDADFAKIKVLGTSFNVQAYDSTNFVEVTVISGTVELISETEKIVLNKGEKGRIDKSSGKIQEKEELTEPEPLWFSRKLVFKDTELRIVADMLSKAYAVDITIKNEPIKYCKWTVTFENAVIEDIMTQMSLVFDLKINKKENKYTISGTTCK